MPDIIVVRGSGLSQGKDIIDSLLTTVQACQARGMMELDDASGTNPVVCECVYRDGLRLGQIVEVYDPLIASVQYGKITSITHTVSSGESILTRIQLVTPSEFVV